MFQPAWMTCARMAACATATWDAITSASVQSTSPAPTVKHVTNRRTPPPPSLALSKRSCVVAQRAQCFLWFWLWLRNYRRPTHSSIRQVRCHTQSNCALDMRTCRCSLNYALVEHNTSAKMVKHLPRDVTCHSLMTGTY